MDEPPAKELLSAEEVAAYLEVQPVTVYRWCRQGRLPCLKLGKVWRIRRAALAEFLRRHEHSPTLAGQLRGFLTVPDQLITIAETREEMYRLDAAFFQVGEARGGLLAKFLGDAVDPVPVVREALERHGLEATRLERAGRLRFIPEPDPLRERVAALRRLLAEEAGEGRPIWASFDWVEGGDLEAALQQQEELAALVERAQLVVQTQVLERVGDEWSPETRRRLRGAYRGLIQLSADGLSLTRRGPRPS